MTEIRIYVYRVVRWMMTVKMPRSNVCLAVVENADAVGIINARLARCVRLIQGNVWNHQAAIVKRVVTHKQRAVEMQRRFV